MLWNRQYHIPASAALTLLSSVSESLRNSKRSGEEAINSAPNSLLGRGISTCETPAHSVEVARVSIGIKIQIYAMVAGARFDTYIRVAFG
jgi:hypothetical protein